MDVKMNCACRAISFVDEHTLVTSGLDAEVYVWGLQVGLRDDVIPLRYYIFYVYHLPSALCFCFCMSIVYLLGAAGRP